MSKKEREDKNRRKTKAVVFKKLKEEELKRTIPFFCLNFTGQARSCFSRNWVWISSILKKIPSCQQLSKSGCCPMCPRNCHQEYVLKFKSISVLPYTFVMYQILTPGYKKNIWNSPTLPVCNALWLYFVWIHSYWKLIYSRYKFLKQKSWQSPVPLSEWVLLTRIIYSKALPGKQKQSVPNGSNKTFGKISTIFFSQLLINRTTSNVHSCAA